MASSLPTINREFVVCKEGDLEENQMKEFTVGGDKKVLLVKYKGQISALGPKCTHYGAPLATGSFCNGVIRCPWHGACFNSTTGDIEEFPGLDSLPKFEVILRNGNVAIRASDNLLQNANRTKTLSRKDPNNNKTFLIIGGGPAGHVCAETLRQEGFTGNVIIATRERNPPYDRPKLSKAMDVDVKTIFLRPPEFYSSADIQVLMNKEAKSIDILKKKVLFTDGQEINYDKLLIATGAVPNTLNVRGNQLRNICLLRTPEEAFAISRAAQGKDVAIIGSSFIGMEVATYLIDKAKSVTVISMTKAPYQFVLGQAIGERLQKMFEEAGVIFHGGRTVAEFQGKNGVITAVKLDNGVVVNADLCVMGVGVHANTDFVGGSGIPINKMGLLSVDAHMKTEANNVYAAGDIVEFPLFIRPERKVTIAHWQMAHAHGRIAALNMLDKNVNLRSVPFFWTVVCKKSLRYAGYGPGYDDIIIHGSLEDLKFIAYYTKANEVIAVASMNWDPSVSKFANLLLSGEKLTKDEISENQEKWMN
ncbi:Apoptosis-inducing factor 3 [Chamberlinius hualienensis]